MKSVRPFTGRHLLGWLVGAFLVVAGANAALVYFALHSTTGLVSPKAYEEGLAYNTTLQSKATQQAMHLSLTRDTQPGQLVYHFTHANGSTPPQAQLKVLFERPLGEFAAHDISCTQLPTSGYACPLPTLARGQWHIQLVLTWPNQSAIFTDSWLQP